MDKFDKIVGYMRMALQYLHSPKVQYEYIRYIVALLLWAGATLIIWKVMKWYGI